MDVLTEYERYLNNPRYQVRIVGLQGGPVIGVMTNEFSIAGANDFGSLRDYIKDIPIVGQFSETVKNATKLNGLMGVSNVIEAETRKVWGSSGAPQFSIDLLFYNSNAEDKDGLLEIYKRIKSGSLPSKNGVFFNAPLGYRFKSKNGLGADGTISLSIGKWFLATGLVMISENFTFANKMNSKGHPIYATAQMTFEPYKQITLEEFKGYIRE